jgi:hypothetical protein
MPAAPPALDRHREKNPTNKSRHVHRRGQVRRQKSEREDDVEPPSQSASSKPDAPTAKLRPLDYWQALGLAADWTERNIFQNMPKPPPALDRHREKNSTPKSPPRPPAPPKFVAKTQCEKTAESHHRNPQAPNPTHTPSQAQRCRGHWIIGGRPGSPPIGGAQSPADSPPQYPLG